MIANFLSLLPTNMKVQLLYAVLIMTLFVIMSKYALEEYASNAVLLLSYLSYVVFSFVIGRIIDVSYSEKALLMLACGLCMLLYVVMFDSDPLMENILAVISVSCVTEGTIKSFVTWRNDWQHAKRGK